MKRIAIVGAGWAGMAAAVEAMSLGAEVTVFEATRTLGGRARRLDVALPDGQALTLDNGQHILIGAYRQTLGMLQRVGLAPGEMLLALPLALRFPDGSGLAVPRWAERWSAPLDTLAAMLGARGWSWRDRLGMLRAAQRWKARHFQCSSRHTVADLCAGITPRAMAELIEPLCVSALNLPAQEASGSVFLRVLRDALFGEGVAGFAPSALLLPRSDLTTLFPEAAARRLIGRGGALHLGERITAISHQPDGWLLATEQQTHQFEQVIWATPPGVAAQALNAAAPQWARQAEALSHTAITTVYLHAAGARLSLPMLALREGPAQFVFDRGQLQMEPRAQGVLAFVISASEGERGALEAAVLAQCRSQLGLQARALQTVTEKRATFACTPGLQRPGAAVCPGLWAAGDYIDGPYPATLEGAVRSGMAAARRALKREPAHGLGSGETVSPAAPGNPRAQ